MPSKQFFSYILARTNFISMRWWWGPLCIRTTHTETTIRPHYLIYNTLSWILIVLKLTETTVRPHYPDSQSLLLLLNVVCSVEKHQLSILIVLCLNWPGLQPTIYQ